MNKLRVAIIGAGPSGLSALEVLQQPEYKDSFEVTVYEKNDYVGGKCCTVFEDGTICNGKPGGYEVGAVVAIYNRWTVGHREFKRLFERFAIKRSSVVEKDRTMFEFIENGQHRTTQNQVSWSLLRTHPIQFLKVLSGFTHYALDYVRYSRIKRPGYTNRPQALNQVLTKKYPWQVHERFIHVMQGFGYANMTDPQLASPTLYYHQYLEPAVLNMPLHVLEGGMQGVWSKLAATFPDGSIRLNQAVTKISRTTDQVSIEANGQRETYDYLIVATPIAPAIQFLDIPKEQQAFLKKMQYSNYVTVLCRASGLDAVGTFNIAACRDRSKIGEVIFSYKRYPDSDVVTLNLFLPTDQAVTDATILDMAAASLQKDLGGQMLQKETATIYRWPDYFGHLDTADLNAGWYDSFDQMFQGKDRTLFVSSGLHMETVSASIHYATTQTETYARKWIRAAKI